MDGPIIKAAAGFAAGTSTANAVGVALVRESPTIDFDTGVKLLDVFTRLWRISVDTELASAIGDWLQKLLDRLTGG